MDGVLYKGRMSSQMGTRVGEKDIAGKHWCFLGFLPWDLTLLVRTRGCRRTWGWGVLTVTWGIESHYVVPHQAPGAREEQR